MRVVFSRKELNGPETFYVVFTYAPSKNPREWNSRTVVVRAGFSHNSCAGVSFLRLLLVVRRRIWGGKGRKEDGKDPS